MAHIDVVKQYFAYLEGSDGKGCGTLFVDSAIIDDANGGHHEGRAAIEEFIANIVAGVRVDAPRHWLEDEPWLTCYGLIKDSGHFEGRRMRWTFHFDGDSISRLTNSWVTFMFGIESGSTSTE